MPFVITLISQFIFELESHSPSMLSTPTHSCTTTQISRKLGVKCLAQGHINMWFWEQESQSHIPNFWLTACAAEAQNQIHTMQKERINREEYTCLLYRSPVFQ